MNGTKVHAQFKQLRQQLSGVYPCPVCRLGQLKALPTMDAIACDFCRHIFTVNLEKQQLKNAF